MSSFRKDSLAKILEEKTDDAEQRVRVMRRVKLMLDPYGSAKGRDLPPEDLDTMTDQ